MSDALKEPSGHRSPFKPIVFLQTNRPGTHRRVGLQPNFLERWYVVRYVFVPANNSLTVPVWWPASDRPDLWSHSVEMTGFEPVTFALQRRCSPAELHPQDLPGLVWA